MRLLLAIILTSACSLGSFAATAGDTTYAVRELDAGPSDKRLEDLDHGHFDRVHPAIAPRALFPEWHAMKKRLEEQYNFSFSLGYSAIYHRSSDTFEGSLAGTRFLRDIYEIYELGPIVPGLQEEAAGGIAEFYGKWTPIRPGTADYGYLGFGIENRHRLGTPITPVSLFLDAGSIWPTATVFGEFDTALLDLYYEQYMHDGRIGFRVGKFIPFAVYDYFSLKNPKVSFNDFAFSLTPAIAWPVWGFGLTGYTKPTENTYINFGMHDINGGAQRGIESFFEDREYFYVVDAGYNTSFDFGKGNIHAMFWHTDKREKGGTPEARGITVAGEQQIGSVLPFLRYAYQDGEAAIAEHFVYGGVGFKEVFGRAEDVIGLAFGWGQPANKELFADNQKSLEAFYRFHLSKELDVTASVTHIIDPPLNLTEDELTMFSIRARFQM